MKIKIRHLVLPLLIALFVYAAYLMYYLGAFKPVVIAEKTAGPWTLLSKEHVGPYHKIVATIEEVEKWAKDAGLTCQFSFGRYLDDPETTEEIRLRSRGGCVWPSPDAKIPERLPDGFFVETLEAQKYVTAVFDGSPGIGPMKVYPKVLEYIEQQKLSKETWTLEIYEVHSEKAMTTNYYFPVK